MIFRLSLSRIVFRWIHGTEDMAIWRKVVDLDYIHLQSVTKLSRYAFTAFLMPHGIFG